MEIYKRSLVLKIIIWVFNLFCLYGLILMIITNDLKFILMPILGIFFLSFYTFVIGVRYIFMDDIIIIKYPFMKERKYFIEDIVGFEYNRVQAESWFIIYFDNKKIKMEVAGKKFKEKIERFSEKYYGIVYKRNIEKIKSNGFEINLSGKKIIFFDNRMEFLAGKGGVYYYDKDIKNIKYFEIIEQFKRLDIETRDNYKIKLLNSKCKGGIGLFEYLMETVKCPNVA